MANCYADIIVDITHESLDRTFQYKVPSSLCDKIVVGDRVKIPFGKGNREIDGFVLGLSDVCNYDPSKMKEIIAISGDSKLVESKLISLANWMHTYYGSTTNLALKTVLPIKKQIKGVVRKTIVLAVSQDEASEYCRIYEKKHMVARLRLVTELINEQSLDYRLVTGKLNISAGTIKYLKEQGVIDVLEEKVYRNSLEVKKDGKSVILNDEQQTIVDDFVKDYKSGSYGTYLIHGITGSGKTEVYMEMIEAVVGAGRQVIVLIPEISLTYQTVMRFKRRFGDRVSTLHSKLSEGEKYDQFERAKKKEIDIIIGPRSALFTPFCNVGLIVIDEEHESSYKSETMPRYHAIEVAKELARLHNASVVLGSATPSVTSYYKAENGEYKLYEISKRAKQSVLPTVHIADLRSELKEGNKSIFSRVLREKIEDRLKKKEQVMLFLNRRGMAGFVSCRSCGHVIKCPHCDVSLSKHRNGKLVCHYCGYQQPDVKVCPECSSTLIGGMRAGTEAVEEQVKRLFPYATTLRMDADTTSTKDGYENILSAFSNHEADILVGTQMIVKGHDFANVTLVGILAADMSLNVGDYRAGERTFQLLVQAAGRAGRGDIPGEVVIQTYQCEHYSIQAAVSQDYKAFFEQEIAYREMMLYPPCGHMMAVLIEAKSEPICQKTANSLAETVNNDIINKLCNEVGYVIGPTAASISKINDIFRYVIYVKAENTNVLIDSKDAIERLVAESADVNSIRVTFDMDPMSGY